MGIQLRTAQIDDVPIIASLITELATEFDTPIAPLEQLKANLKKYEFDGENVYKCEIAYYDNEVAGFIFYYFSFCAYQGRKLLYLENLYIRPPFRRHKVGTRLMERLMEIAKEHECYRTEWHVYKSNKTAQQFYSALNAEIRDDYFRVFW